MREKTNQSTSTEGARGANPRAVERGEETGPVSRTDVCPRRSLSRARSVRSNQIPCPKAGWLATRTCARASYVSRAGLRELSRDAVTSSRWYPRLYDQRTACRERPGLRATQFRHPVAKGSIQIGGAFPTSFAIDRANDDLGMRHEVGLRLGELCSCPPVKTRSIQLKTWAPQAAVCPQGNRCCSRTASARLELAVTSVRDSRLHDASLTWLRCLASQPAEAWSGAGKSAINRRVAVSSMVLGMVRSAVGGGRLAVGGVVPRAVARSHERFLAPATACSVLCRCGVERYALSVRLGE